jgi:hypothetical protein
MHQRALKALDLLAPAAAVTQTTTGSYLDLIGTPSGNIGRREMKAMQSVGGATVGNGTYTTKIQECATSNGSFTDITGAAFAAVTQNTGVTELHFYTAKRYIQAVCTVAGGTPSAVIGVSVLVEKRYP